MPWLVMDVDDAEVGEVVTRRHVVPGDADADLQNALVDPAHVLAFDCPCSPTVQYLGDGTPLYIHHIPN